LAANAARGGRDASPADRDTFANVHLLVRQTLFDGAPELTNEKLVEVYLPPSRSPSLWSLVGGVVSWPAPAGNTPGLLLQVSLVCV
jgi:hypothetical protein